MSGRDVSTYSIRASASIREVIEAIDRAGRVSIALVVDDAKRLVATITDGDVRRGMLAGLTLDAPATALFPIKARLPHPRPVTAAVGTDPGTLIGMMTSESVRQIPLLDGEGRVVDIVILADLLPPGPPDMDAVIMAGGAGMRLRPLTEDRPKPMLPVGGRPLLEWIVDQLRGSGIENINVATHYRAEQIIGHFGDGAAFDVKMSYLNEIEPLGTAGALSLLPAPERPLLVINGDILTRVDFRTMFAYHREQRAEMTVAVRHFAIDVPFGVVESDGPWVRSLSEKPQMNLLVNAGIYLLEPSVLRVVPRGTHFNMTEVISRLLEDDRPVVSFPILEYWIDIGRGDDYRSATESAERVLNRKGGPSLEPKP